MSKINLISKIELWPVERLAPYDRNPRVHTQEQVEALKVSLKKYGFNGALRVHRELGICGGNGTFEALKQLGLKKIPVMCLDHLSVMDAKGFILADNKSYELGGWDDKLTAELLADLSGSAFCLEDTLFSDKEIDRLTTALDRALPEEAGRGVPEDDEEAAQPMDFFEKKWGVKVGQIWECGRHRILCGDCTPQENIARLMGEARGLVLTDPPYGIAIQKKSGRMGGNGKLPDGSKLQPKDYPNFHNDNDNDNDNDNAKNHFFACRELGFEEFVIWGGNYFTDFLPPSMGWIIWDKRPDGSQNDFADCEMAWTSFDRATKIHRQLWDGFRRAGEKIDRIHPTQKPIELLKYCIGWSEQKNIFDGFMGSGVTMMAAERLDRNFFGMELHTEFFGRILERWKNETGMDPKKIEG